MRRRHARLLTKRRRRARQVNLWGSELRTMAEWQDLLDGSLERAFDSILAKAAEGA